MALLSETLSNLTNGISQQPAHLRLTSQCSDQTNVLDFVSLGKCKRKGAMPCAETDFIALTRIPSAGGTGASGGVVVPMLSVLGETPVVWDGSSLNTVVPGTGALAYILSGQLKITRVDDYFLVLNTERTVSISGSGPAVSGKKFLLQVAQGNYSTSYQVLVTVNGVVHTATKTTDASNPADTRVTQIASDLAVALNALAAVTAEFDIYQRDSAIYLVQKIASAATVGVAVADSKDSKSIKAVYNTVQRITDLPTIGTASFPAVAVVGENTSYAFPYYVTFQLTQEADANGLATGLWVESSDGSSYTINNETMPYKLWKDSGTWKLDPCEWSSKTVGDTTSDPVPAFSSLPIRDVAVFKGRLCFISGSKFIASETNNYFNFWRKTVTQVLDTDTISVAIASLKSSTLRHMAVFRDGLMVTSDSAQYVLYSEALTPRTVGFTHIGDYQCDLYSKPVVLGNSMYLAASNGVIWEFTTGSLVSSETTSVQAESITKHVPTLLGTGTMTLQGDEKTGTLLVLNASNSVFAYKPWWAGAEKLQSSWTRLEPSPLADGTIPGVYSIAAVAGALYWGVERSKGAGATGIFLESIDLLEEPPAASAGLEAYSHLDRWAGANSDAATAGGRDYTLPFYHNNAVRVISSNSALTGYANGTDLADAGLTISYPAENVVRVVGATAGWLAGLRFGERYTTECELSPIFIRDESGMGILGGRLQLRDVTFRFSEVGAVTCTVLPENASAPSSQSFTTAHTTTVTQVKDWRVPVMAKANAVITLSSPDHRPMKAVALTWRGNYHNKARSL